MPLKIPYEVRCSNKCFQKYLGLSQSPRSSSDSRTGTEKKKTKQRRCEFLPIDGTGRFQVVFQRVEEKISNQAGFCHQAKPAGLWKIHILSVCWLWMGSAQTEVFESCCDQDLHI